MSERHEHATDIAVSRHTWAPTTAQRQGARRGRAGRRAHTASSTSASPRAGRADPRAHVPHTHAAHRRTDRTEDERPLVGRRAGSRLLKVRASEKNEIVGKKGKKRKGDDLGQDTRLHDHRWTNPAGRARRGEVGGVRRRSAPAAFTRSTGTGPAGGGALPPSSRTTCVCVLQVDMKRSASLRRLDAAERTDSPSKPPSRVHSHHADPQGQDACY